MKKHLPPVSTLAFLAVAILTAFLPLAWVGGIACLALAVGWIWRDQLVALIRR